MRDLKRKRIISYTVVIIVAVFVLTLGIAFLYAYFKPSVKISGGLKKDEVFRIDDIICKTQEFNVLMYDQKKKYDDLYGVEFWDKKIVDIEAKDFLIKETLNQMAVYKCSRLLAADKKIILNSSEKEAAQIAAKEYIEAFSADEIAKLNISEEGARKLYEDKILYNKVFEFLTTTVNEEISVDEARVIKIQYIYVAKSQPDSKAIIDDLYAKVLANDSFEKLAVDNNGIIGYECMLVRGQVDKGFEDAAFELSKDEHSEIVTTGEGYYIIKCINDYEKAATENNKSTILNNRKNEIFKSIYDEYIDGLYYELNEKLISKYSFRKKEIIKVGLE